MNDDIYIELDDETIIIEKKDLEKKEDNYLIRIFNKVSDKRATLIVGVIDINGNIKVPLQCFNTNFKNIKNGNLEKNIFLFDNNKVIYKLYDNYYLVDINNTNFKICGNDLVPENFILQFDSFKKIDENEIIIYMKNNSFIYDITGNKFLSNVYDYVDTISDCKNIFDAYIAINNKNCNPLVAKFIINDNNEILEEVLLNNEIFCFIPKYIEKNEKKIKEYLDSCFNKYFVMCEEDDLCKKMIH